MALKKIYHHKAVKTICHSLRSGGITSVVRNSCNSVSERLLKVHGRWKTDAAKDMYVEESLDNSIDVSLLRELKGKIIYVRLSEAN